MCTIKQSAAKPLSSIATLAATLALLAACSGESSSETADAMMQAADKPSGNADAMMMQAEGAAAQFPIAALMDPNTASAEALAAVPGMSAAAVNAIINARPFATPGAMHAAVGATLDDASRNKVYARVFVKVGLNTGAESDYKLIPSSMSPRKLAHEFEEYRPYESMAQFSREMAKYVSDDEVAYLQRFVTLD